MGKISAGFSYGWFPDAPHSEVRQEYDSPSSILAKYLVDTLEAFTDPDEGQAWPLYDAGMPEFDTVEFECAAIYDTTPILDEKTMQGAYIAQYGIQLRLRSLLYETGYRKLSSIAATLALAHGVEVEMPEGQMYEIVNISVASDAVFIGRDQKNRSHFTGNFLLKLKVLV